MFRNYGPGFTLLCLSFQKIVKYSKKVCHRHFPAELESVRCFSELRFVDLCLANAAPINIHCYLKLSNGEMN